MVEAAPSTARRLTTNAFALLAAQLAVRLASLVVVLLLGQLLGPDGLGLYAMATAVAALAVVIADAGADVVTVRAMAAGRAAANYLGGLLPLRLLLTAAALLAAALGASVAGYPAAAVWLTVALTTSMALEIVAGSLRAALRAAETMVSEAGLIVAGQTLRALAGGLLLGLAWWWWRDEAARLVPGLMLFGLAVVVAATLSLLLSLRQVARRIGWPRPRLDLALWRQTLWQIAPVTLYLILTQIGSRSDAIIIGQWWPPAEAGRFHAASGLLSALNMVVAMALAALYPRLVRQRAAGAAATWGLTEPMLAGGLALALALALIAPLAIEPAIVLALGERFSGASAPLALMRWALPAFVVSGVAGVLLRAQGEDRPLVIVAAVGAAISLLFNLLLIPAHGALGAATSTLLAELTMALLAAGLVWRRHRGLWRPLLIGGLAGSLAGLSGLIGAGLAPDSWWLATGLAAGLAGGLLGATGGLWMIVRRRSDRLGV